MEIIVYEPTAGDICGVCLNTPVEARKIDSGYTINLCKECLDHLLKELSDRNRAA